MLLVKAKSSRVRLRSLFSEKGCQQLNLRNFLFPLSNESLHHLLPLEIGNILKPLSLLCMVAVSMDTDKEGQYGNPRLFLSVLLKGENNLHFWFSKVLIPWFFINIFFNVRQSSKRYPFP